MDPLIIFKGRNLQSTWLGKESLRYVLWCKWKQLNDNINIPWLVSKICMQGESETNSSSFWWPLTHLSGAVELALAENISLVKLPAYGTDVLQPLDVLCFSPLKIYYEKFLTEFVHRNGGRQKLTKPAFCNLIVSIWKKVLTAENVISGFKNTGTFSVDSNKYKISCLDKVKLKNYNLWKAHGAPVDEDGPPVLTTEDESDKATLVNTSRCWQLSPELCHYFICCRCSVTTRKKIL